MQVHHEVQVGLPTAGEGRPRDAAPDSRGGLLRRVGQVRMAWRVQMMRNRKKILRTRF